jgi:hypothetical protein
MNPTIRPEDDDIDSRDKQCLCPVSYSGDGSKPRVRMEECPRHGIGASLARENRYWQRVGRD